MLVEIGIYRPLALARITKDNAQRMVNVNMSFLMLIDDSTGALASAIAPILLISIT